MREKSTVDGSNEHGPGFGYNQSWWELDLVDDSTSDCGWLSLDPDCEWGQVCLKYPDLGPVWNEQSPDVSLC